MVLLLGYCVKPDPEAHFFPEAVHLWAGSHWVPDPGAEPKGDP